MSEFLDELNAKLEEQNDKIEALTKRVILLERDLITSMRVEDFIDYCKKYNLDPEAVIKNL